jgi:hypothetical protein
VTEHVTFQTIIGFEGLETVHALIEAKVVVAALDVQFELVGGAKCLSAIIKRTRLHIDY